MKDFKIMGSGLIASDLDDLPIDSYFSKSGKLHYIATPKVACTSLKWWFARLEGYNLSTSDLRRSRETEPDLAIHDLLPNICPSIVARSRDEELEIFNSHEYFRFAVVRNPYKRIFSAWQSKLLLHEPSQIAPYFKCDFFTLPIMRLEDIALRFEGFMEYIAEHEWPNISNPHWAPQAQVLRVGKVNYSMIAQIENAEPLWDQIAKKLKREDFERPLETRTNESLIPYRPEFISVRSQELINKLYSEDFECFYYSKELPLAKELFGKEQVHVAMKAVSMIQGRNRRFGEVRELLAEADNKVLELGNDLIASEAEKDVLRVELDKYEVWGKEQARQVKELQTVLGEYARDIGALQERLGTSEAEKEVLRAELEKYEVWGKEQAKQVTELQTVLGEYSRDIGAFEAETKILISEKTRLSDELESVLKSLSWRLTIPFRWLYHRITSYLTNLISSLFK